MLEKRLEAQQKAGGKQDLALPHLIEIKRSLAAIAKQLGLAIAQQELAAAARAADPTALTGLTEEAGRAASALQSAETDSKASPIAAVRQLAAVSTWPEGVALQSKIEVARAVMEIAALIEQLAQKEASWVHKLLELPDLYVLGIPTRAVAEPQSPANHEDLQRLARSNLVLTGKACVTS